MSKFESRGGEGGEDLATRGKLSVGPIGIAVSRGGVDWREEARSAGTKRDDDEG